MVAQVTEKIKWRWLSWDMRVSIVTVNMDSVNMVVLIRLGMHLKLSKCCVSPSMSTVMMKTHGSPKPPILADVISYSTQHSQTYDDFFLGQGHWGGPAEISQAHDRGGSDYCSSDSWHHTQTCPEHAGVHRWWANVPGLSSANYWVPCLTER